MLNWFSSFRPHIVKHDDSFARTTQGKLLGIKSSIDGTLADPNQRVIILSHFAETFTRTQDMLDQHDLEYDVPTASLDDSWFKDLKSEPVRLQTTMTQMLTPFSKTDVKHSQPIRLSIILTERHPSIMMDERVERFCNSLPCKAQWGYFLSFEDTVVRKLMDYRAIALLDMFGMGQNELVSSKMLSSRLNHALKKISAHHEPIEADSADVWFEKYELAKRES